MGAVNSRKGFVIPAKAGIQTENSFLQVKYSHSADVSIWLAAFAGMAPFRFAVSA